MGDVAVLVGRIHYRGKASGIETEPPAGWMLKSQDGKVLRFRAFREPKKAFEAVGLRDEAMSQENVDLVRSACAAYNRGDWESVRDVYHPEVIWDLSTYLAACSPRRGARV